MGKAQAEKKCLHLSQHLREHDSFLMLLCLCMHTSPRLVANPDSVHVV